MTISDRLHDLITAKEDMKSAIEEKGVEVTGGLTSYADAIDSIIPPIVDVKVFDIYAGIQLNNSVLESPIVLHFADCLFNVWNGAGEPYYNTTCIGYIKSCPNVIIIDIDYNDSEMWGRFNWCVHNLPYRSNKLNISFERNVIDRMTDSQKQSLINNGYIINTIRL